MLQSQNDYRMLKAQGKNAAGGAAVVKVYDPGPDWKQVEDSPKQ